MPEIMLDKINKALKQTKKDKSAGDGQILLEMLKEGGETAKREVQELLNRCLTA